MENRAKVHENSNKVYHLNMVCSNKIQRRRRLLNSPIGRRKMQGSCFKLCYLQNKTFHNTQSGGLLRAQFIVIIEILSSFVSLLYLKTPFLGNFHSQATVCLLANKKGTANIRLMINVQALQLAIELLIGFLSSQ
ncbi:hypothetical protein FGO68_gene10158 [Halteria grandinella]|uniref:Transmembrane protein n=1 Tax=Halteria grandinella TaxID=5974 RepID=A0A8J8TA08_HALGN|nr:hypothetical protein FGO68_gene10158 [Halteria grandinella]